MKRVLYALPLLAVSLVAASVWADPMSPEVQQSRMAGERNKLKVAAVPVFPWLIVGQTPYRSVSTFLAGRPDVLILSTGTSALSNGELVNFSERGINSEGGLFSEPGLRMISLSFSPKGTKILEYVQFMVERGYEDRFVEPMIERLSTRYSDLATPIRVKVPDSEAEDVYVLYDLGRYVVETYHNENSSFFTVIFSTRDIYNRIREANGASEVVFPYLSDWSKG